MIKTSDKIILVVFAILLIGINSFFITALAINENNLPESSHSSITLSTAITKDVDEDEREIDDEDEKDDEISSEELDKIDGLITEEQAEQIALEHIGKGTVTNFESEREGGKILYEVEIDNEVEVEIDAESGRILEVEWEDEEDDD